MAIEDRSPEPGTVYEARYKGAIVECVVGTNEEGKLTYTVNGQTFNSPSKAGSYAAGGTSVNGYRFWTPKGELGEGRKAAAPKGDGETKAKKGKTAKAPEKRGGDTITKMRKPMAEQGEGQTSWFCTACMKGFVVDGKNAPSVCPEGHTKAGTEFGSDEGQPAVAETEGAEAAEPAGEPVTLDI